MRFPLCLGVVAPLLGPTIAGAEIPKLVGVNYSGAEYGKRTGRLYKNYTYPSIEGLSYFHDQGFNVVRLPLKWERVQPEPNGPLNEGELGEIRKVVQASKSRGDYVILDPHNYGRYGGKPIGSDELPTEAFVDFWKRLAAEFRDSDNVVFGLMNEPNKFRADDWRDIAQSAVSAIREAGAGNLILVPGTAWTGAHSWRKSGNAAAMEQFRDSGNNFAFEVHQYLDPDSSGTKPVCPDPESGARALARMADWLESVNGRAFLGEFGASADCTDALKNMLDEIQKQPHLWVGWSYWAAGDWWGDYPFSVQPAKDGTEKPQLPVLQEAAQRLKATASQK